MAQPLRWGVIGTGGIARTFVKDLSFVDDGVAVAVGSRSMASANAFGDAFSIAHRYDSYEAMVRDPEVEAVYVATPHPMHFANALLALEHDKHVLVEKAFTVTAQEAVALVRVARERRRFLMEAMWTRFLPHVAKVRELIAQGTLGELVLVEADHGQWFELDPTMRLFDPDLGGGAVLDLGVYPISFASMLLGPPSSVTAKVDPAFTGVDGQSSMIFGYDNGAQALLTCTSLARTSTRACIAGAEARIEIDSDFYAPTSFRLIKRSGEVTAFDFDTVGRGLHYEASEVARCIREGLLESPLMPLDETIEIMATMEEVLAHLAPR